MNSRCPQFREKPTAIHIQVYRGIWRKEEFQMCVILLEKSACVISCQVVSDSLQHHGLVCPWYLPGKNT